MPKLSDTPPEIAAMVRERLMARTGAERFEMGSRMFDAAREMSCASFPKGPPDERQRKLLFERIYGTAWDPPVAESRFQRRQPKQPAECVNMKDQPF